MQYYVYQLRREDCDYPFYIGKGLDNRMYQHSQEFEKNKIDEDSIVNPLKFEAFLNAENDKVEVLAEILFDDLSENDAFLLEIETIKKYGRIVEGGCLTNLTNGGEGGNTLVDPIIRKKWEKAMKEVNQRPEVKAKRSKSAKAMWGDPIKRKNLQEAQLKSITLKRIENNRHNSWTEAKEKWICAENFYDMWISIGKPAYRKFENYLTSKGYPKYNMQKMIKYFQKISPREDTEYQSWKLTINI